MRVGSNIIGVSTITFFVFPSLKPISGRAIKKNRMSPLMLNQAVIKSLKEVPAEDVSIILLSIACCTVDELIR